MARQKYKTKFSKTGTLIGWKRCYYRDRSVLVKLLIPAKARRVCPGPLYNFDRKCRAEYAKVLKFYKVESWWDTKLKVANVPLCRSGHDKSFVYKIGKVVRPRLPFDDSPFAPCRSGIHFYMDPKFC